MGLASAFVSFSFDMILLDFWTLLAKIIKPVSKTCQLD